MHEIGDGLWTHLLPVVTATGADGPAAAEVKGRAAWADILCRAMSERDPAISDFLIAYGCDALLIPADPVAELLSAAGPTPLVGTAAGSCSGRRCSTSWRRRSSTRVDRC